MCSVYMYNTAALQCSYSATHEPLPLPLALCLKFSMLSFHALKNMEETLFQNWNIIANLVIDINISNSIGNINLTLAFAQHF